MKNKLTAFASLALFTFHLTATARPLATTLTATGVTATNAALHGLVNPNGVIALAY